MLSGDRRGTLDETLTADGAGYGPIRYTAFMRTLLTQVVVLALFATSCAEHTPLAPPIGDGKLQAPFDAWDGAPEVVVRQDRAVYQYPDNFYDSPTGEAKVWRGRWAIDFEGSIFHDYDTGEYYTTTGVDDALRAHVEVGKSYYDWSGCLEVTIRAAVSELPSPFRGAGPWMVISETLSVEKVEGHESFGDPCIDFQANERRITIP